jgi:hypothetical protein
MNDLRSALRTAAIVSCFFLVSNLVWAQGWNASLFVQSYPSPYVGDWQTNPSLATLTITNPSTTPTQVQFYLTITKRTTGAAVASGNTSPILIQPSPPQTTLNNTQFIQWNNITYDEGVRTIVIRSGRLPEGDYSACVVVKNVAGATLVSRTCAWFSIVYPNAPRLLIPENGYTQPLPLYPTFTWTPTTTPPGYPIHYIFTLVELLPNQLPVQGLTSNVPYYENNNVLTSTLLYPIDAQILRVGQTYAWWVQALDQYGYPAATNNGRSEAFTFTFRTEGFDTTRPVSPCFVATPMSPENGRAWTESIRPRFRIDARPAIIDSGITGGRLQVWAMENEEEGSSSVTSRSPVIDTSFSGDGPQNIELTSLDTAETSLDLKFVNDTTSQSTTNLIPQTWYMWKFTLTVNSSRIRADRRLCSATEVSSSYATFKYAPSLADTGGACRDVCTIAAPTDQSPASRTFSAGDTVRVGRFTMVLTGGVNGSGSSLSGNGLIAIPFLNCQLAVEFSGIQVNDSAQVYAGEVKGEQAENSPLSDGEANGQGTALNLDSTRLSAIYALASNSARLTSALTGQTPMTLPIGMDNVIGGQRFVVGIIGAVFTPTQANLNAAIVYPLPGLGPNIGIGLGARGICFHPNGIGGNGNATLYLAADIGYRRSETWSFAFLAPSGSDPGCYVTFDCTGFKEFRLSAEVEFPRSWLRPFPDVPNQKVKAKFSTTAARGGNWIIAASMDRCEISAAPGFVMEVQDMTFDNSDQQNPEGIVFPDGYTGPTDDTWLGFFIQRASISLPPQLRTFDATSPPQIAVDNLLIGREGITGSFRVENVFQYPTGNFGQWGGSLDTLGVDVLCSSLRRGWMTGKIKMPIADEPLKYTATLSRPQDSSRGLRYAFVIEPTDTLNADLWKARISLYPTSNITLSNESGSFVASATLNGRVSIAGTIGSFSGLDFVGIEFQDLILQTTRPYIVTGTWSFASPERRVAGFPVTLSNIGIASTQRGGRDLVGIRFSLSVNVQGGSNAISGTTALTIWGELQTTGAQRFSYNSITLDSIGISADLGAVKISGGVAFFSEVPRWGKGFRGVVTATFLKKIDVSCTVQFGNVNGFRYWYVDAKAVLNPGIPLMSGVGFYGLGGGAWYHMRRSGGDPGVPTSSAVAGRSPGSTVSGYSFQPDESVLFGLRAMVILGTHPNSATFNADVALEVEVLSSGGVGRISLLGRGYMMAEVSARQRAKVTMSADMTYDFPERTLHGVFDVRISAAPVTGGGQAVLHFEPSTWYIKIGEPDSRIGLHLGWLSVNGYLMVGKDLPPPGQPPAQVTAMLGQIPATRNSSVAAGDGFALGASIWYDTGRKTFFIFYGRFIAGGGFDIAMMKQARCTGVNGWYGQGDVYAYISGSVGIYVEIGFWMYRPCGRWYCPFCRWCKWKFIGIRGEWEILGISAAALLEAGVPNPMWVKGTVAGRYSVLGGLIHGHCSFSFTTGTVCRL